MWRAPGIVAVLVGVGGGAACDHSYPISVPTLVRSAVDVSSFRSVLVAGFATHPGEPIDTNEEMVRLLRTQLRIRSRLRVIESDAPPVPSSAITDAAHWRRVGEEYGGPLIVTGSVAFHVAAEPLFGYETVLGRRSSAAPVVLDRPRFIVEPTLVFIDGGTGAALCTRTFHDEIVYGVDEHVPPLSAFFDLMERLLPDVLSIVVDQSFASPRTLLK